MQITLNCDTEYKGGRIVFYTKNGFSIHKRPAGFLTSHDWNILHGVTKIHSGVRYSLFVVDKTNELGRKGVYYMDVSDINTCLLYTSPSPRDRTRSRMPSSA